MGVIGRHSRTHNEIKDPAMIAAANGKRSSDAAGDAPLRPGSTAAHMPIDRAPLSERPIALCRMATASANTPPAISETSVAVRLLGHVRQAPTAAISLTSPPPIQP